MDIAWKSVTVLLPQTANHKHHSRRKDSKHVKLYQIQQWFILQYYKVQ